MPSRDTAARGVLPRRPGDELPEDAIRRVRDGNPDTSWDGWRMTVGHGRVRHNRSGLVGKVTADSDEGVVVAWDCIGYNVFYDRYEAVDKLESVHDGD